MPRDYPSSQRCRSRHGNVGVRDRETYLELSRRTSSDVADLVRADESRALPALSGSGLISRRVSYRRAKTGRHKEKGKTREMRMKVKREEDGERSAK